MIIPKNHNFIVQVVDISIYYWGKIMDIGVQRPIVARDSGCWGGRYTWNRDGGGKYYVQDIGEVCNYFLEKH